MEVKLRKNEKKIYCLEKNFKFKKFIIHFGKNWVIVYITAIKPVIKLPT